MTFYPLADWPQTEDWKRLGLDKKPFEERMRLKRDIKAVNTNEFRLPKQGDWFLSGAIVEAYRWNSPTPGTSKCHIAKLVLTKTVTTTVTVPV
jgi:hypothetical protein